MMKRLETNATFEVSIEALRTNKILIIHSSFSKFLFLANLKNYDGHLIIKKQMNLIEN